MIRRPEIYVAARTAVTLLLLAAGTANAQQTDLPPAALERLERVRMERLREALELDEATARELGRLMQNFRRERHEAALAQRSATQTLQRTLQRRPVDENEVSRALEALERSRRSAHELGQRQLAELGRVLSPSQRAKFLLFNRQFDERLRQELVKRRIRRPTDRRPAPGQPRGANGLRDTQQPRR